MPLLHLDTYQFRNLKNVSISLAGDLQIIYGQNAAGKTSLLEAIYTLCSGKSFLGAAPRKLQQFDCRDFSLRGDISLPEGFNEQLQLTWKDSSLILKAGGEHIRRISEYARLQPVQSISPASFRIIDESPDVRRRFIDWGVFHVKHDYVSVWQRHQRCLAQRNKLLTQQQSSTVFAPWDSEYAVLSHQVDEFRRQYIDHLQPIFKGIVERLVPGTDIDIVYLRGWDEGLELSTILSSAFNKDLQRGYTFYGPQRAELSIKMNQRSARDIASRGQKKLITYALYLAQAQLQQQAGNFSNLLVVDDLPSELDQEHQRIVFELLNEVPMQVVISCIDLKSVEALIDRASKVFHVKQGRVKEVVQ